ncbi:hypothetical protein QTN25_001105 [Entamoeba marina]
MKYLGEDKPFDMEKYLAAKDRIKRVKNEHIPGSTESRSALEIIRETYDQPQYNRYREIRFHVSFRYNDFNKEYIDMIIEDTIGVFSNGEICFIKSEPYINYYHIMKLPIMCDKILIYDRNTNTYNIRDPEENEIIEYNQFKTTDLAEDEGLVKLLQK